MSKTRDTGFLGNVVKVDASGNVSFVSGSTTLATINTSGQLSGSSPVLSASYASNAELLDGLDSTVFTLTSSFNAQTASFTAFSSSINSFSASILSFTASQNITNGTFTTTASFNAQTASFTAFTSSINTFSASILTFTGSASTRLGALESYTSSLNDKTSSFATTGSNAFIGTQTITGSVLQSGSFTSTGTLTAQTLVVQTITSSVVYSSGSNIFGNAIGNTQTFTGSVLITGSLTISTGGNASAPTIFGSTIACSPIGCFTTSCATSFIGGTMSGTTIYGSTAVCSAVGKFSTCLDLGGALTGTSATFSGIVAINGATNSGGLSVKTVSSVGLNIQGTAASALMSFTPVTYDEYRIGAGDVNVNDFGIRNATRAVTYLSFSGGASGGASTFSSTITGTTIYGSTAVCSPVGLFSGCVGIGTVSPNGNLQFGNSTNTRKIVLYQGGNNDYEFYGFGVESGKLIYSTYTTSDDHVFVAGTSSTARNTLMTVKGNGNVGINCSSPSGKLHIGNSGTQYALYTAQGNLELYTPEGNCGYVRLGSAYNLNGVYGGCGLNYLAAGTSNHVFYTTDGPTERMRITNEGYLGTTITSTSVTCGDLLGLLSFVSRDSSTYSSGGITNIRSYATETYNTSTVGGDLRFYVSDGLQNTTGNFCFGTEAMRIGPAGRVGIGGCAGTNALLHVFGDVAIGSAQSGGDIRLYVTGATGTKTPGLFNNTNGGTGNESIVLFQRTNGTVGSISSTNTTTAYNTSSDYRLKEDLKEVSGLDKVSAIKVYDFKWKSNDNRMDGILAHELQQVLPYAVIGEKDAEQMQGVDYSKLVPILVKGMQEQQCTICSQASMINTLKTCLGIA